MATNLPSIVNTGQINACLFRVARLNANCAPTGGNNSGYVTTGLATMNATPDVEEGTKYEPKNACGAIMFTYETSDVIKRWNITGELLFHDAEAAELLFGGSLILGKTGGAYAGKVIGYAPPNYNEARNNGVYLEVITQAIAEGAGDCASSATNFPPYIGNIFGKVKVTPGEKTFEEDVARFTFSGTATGNPNLYNGPWNDYPGAGYIKNTPWQTVGYSSAEYSTILAAAAAGFATLPAGS